jgi:hypothetical protein
MVLSGDPSSCVLSRVPDCATFNLRIIEDVRAKY